MPRWLRNLNKRQIIRGIVVVLIIGLVGMFVRELMRDTSPFAKMRSVMHLSPHLSTEFSKIQDMRDRQALAAATFYMRSNHRDLFRRGAAQMMPMRDLCRVALGLDEADRMQMLSVYGPLFEQQVTDNPLLAEKIGLMRQHLQRLSQEGGSDFEAVRESPMYLYLYGEYAQKDNDLWRFLKAEASWAEDFLGTYALDFGFGGASVSLEELDTVVRYMNQYSGLFKAFYEEYRDISEDLRAHASPDERENLERMLSDFISLFLMYPETFDEVARNCPGASMVECSCIILNNYTLDTDEAGEEYMAFLPECRDNRERGAVLSQLYNYKLLWKYATTQGRLLELTSVVGMSKAEDLLDSVDYPDLVTFLMNFYTSVYPAKPDTEFKPDEALLCHAVQAVIRYRELALVMLTTHEASPRFKKLLANPNIAEKLIPFYQAKMQDMRIDNQVEILNGVEAELTGKQAEGWMKRRVSKDGEARTEEDDLLESCPFVGGIWGVAKHLAKGEAVTMGEVGWAAYDVVEIGVTVVSFGTSVAATRGTSTAVKGGGKLAKRGFLSYVKAGGKAIGRGTWKVLSAGPKWGWRKFRYARMSKLARFMYNTKHVVGKGFKIVKGAAAKTMKTARAAGDKVRGAWKALTPRTRTILKISLIVGMAGVEMIGRRTPERVPQALGSLVKSVTAFGTNTVIAVSVGTAQGINEAIADSVGMTHNRWNLFVCPSLALIFMVALWMTRERRRTPEEELLSEETEV